MTSVSLAEGESARGGAHGRGDGGLKGGRGEGRSPFPPLRRRSLRPPMCVSKLIIMEIE